MLYKVNVNTPKILIIVILYYFTIINRSRLKSALLLKHYKAIIDL